jgi:hypothetical protein
LALMSNPFTDIPSLPRQRTAVRAVSFIPNTKAAMWVSNARLPVAARMNGERDRVTGDAMPVGAKCSLCLSDTIKLLR